MCFTPLETTMTQWVQPRMVLVVNFFVFLKLNFFCSVVAIFDLVHDVEAMFPHHYLLTSSGNLSEI